MLTFTERIRRNFQRRSVSLQRRCIITHVILKRNSNMARVLVIRVMNRVPIRPGLTINKDQLTSVRQRKLIRSNLMHLMVLLSFTTRLIYRHIMLT